MVAAFFAASGSAEALRGIHEVDIMELQGMARVMEPASKALALVVGDSKKISEFVSGEQASVRARLTEERAKFEAALTRYSEENRNISEHTRSIMTSVYETNLQIKSLVRRNRAIQNSTRLVRTALAEIRDKSKLCMNFLEHYREEVGNLMADEVDAMKPTTPKPTLDYFLAIARREVGVSHSLLQISSPATSLSVQDYLPNITDTLRRIAAAEKHSIDVLHAKFDVANQTLAKKHESLVNASARAADTLKTTKQTQHQLEIAQARLESTNKNAKDNLLASKEFLSKISEAMKQALDLAEVASRGVSLDDAARLRDV